MKVKPISIKKSFEALTGSDDTLLFHNPDRGFRSELCLLIKEKYPDEVYFQEGLCFETEQEAEEHQVEKGPGYALEPVRQEDGSISHYTVKYVEKSRSLFCDKDEAYNRSIIEGVLRSYLRLDKNDQYRYDPSYLLLAYIYFTDFHDRAISKEALGCLEQYFIVCRERKIKNMLRVAYNWGYLIPHNESEKNKWLLSSVCADQGTIDLHTKQLCHVVGEYKDTIHNISNGFVGFVGEWAWHYQWPEIDYNKATLSIMDNLCVPNGIYFSARLPKYRYDFQKAYPHYEHHDLIALNNDAVYGEQEYESPYTTPDGKKHINRWNSGDYGLHIQDDEYGISWWDLASETAYKTPQDGEMFVQQALTSWGMRPYGYDVMLECAHHRHTSLSYWHGYLDTNENPDYMDTNIMTSWQNPDDLYGYYAPLTIDKIKEMGIVYDPAWFFDYNGNPIKSRNAYEFLRDHLGYRICLEDVALNWSGNLQEKARISLNLKNYGFAAAFNLSSRIIIFDDSGKEVVSAKIGEPSSWVSLPADVYPGNDYVIGSDIQSLIPTHQLSCEINMPSVPGKYYVAFCLESSANNTARVANVLEFQNGYNVLFDFEV